MTFAKVSIAESIPAQDPLCAPTAVASESSKRLGQQRASSPAALVPSGAEGTLLDQLDRRQNHVLSELDALNDRIGQLMQVWQAERGREAA